ncbi:MoaD/ThiS family protein [Candidatus Poriferisodalis sp.]|uniref:MoaD/ThiS family protein n=1 Tax=Candidatus Poriferisodalis sp. TaxID=3101277 RepID=UPI003B01D724
MAVVHFSTDQRQHTGGISAVTVNAANVRELVRQLSALYPSLNAHLVETSSTAVAIDGEIIPDPWLEALTETSEVYLVRPLAGG